MGHRSLHQAQIDAAIWATQAWTRRARALRATGDHTSAAAAQARADTAAAEHQALAQRTHTYEQPPLFTIQET